MEIKRISTANDYDWAFELMLETTASYIYKVLDMMKISLDEFKDMMKKTGEVYILKENEKPIGFYWIETRDHRLHIHAICIHKDHQGKGYGKYLMNEIFEKREVGIHAIELGVEMNNDVAITLYKKLGFIIVNQLEDLGFYIMEKVY
jgi:ribosomal protein S18 acetylase RimI-like enzyme